MKTDQSLKTKIIKLKNSLKINDQELDNMNSSPLLKKDDELSDEFLSLYNSGNQSVVNENDSFFHKAFRAFLQKNQK